MSSMSSLNTATSGLRAAQAGLYVIGHNISNSSIDGYTRQRVLQHDFFYSNIGTNYNGALQKGLGSDITSIKNVRDNFIDISYRQEVGRANFYAMRAEVGSEMEYILGELQSQYNAQSVINDIWNALNELNNYQPGLETRANFISTAATFIKKASNVYEGLIEYQYNLNSQISGMVTRINQLVESVASYNTKIKMMEFSGDNANDFRDARNMALDELSEYLDIEYTIRPDGTVDIMADGHDLLMGNSINKIGLKYCTPGYSFVEPVFTSSKEILPVNQPVGSYTPLFDLTDSIAPEKGNDSGKLKGLMISRGYSVFNYASEPGNKPDATDLATYPGGTSDPKYKYDLEQYQHRVADSEYCAITRVQKQFDAIVNRIVTLINDSVAPRDHDSTKAPWGLDDVSQFNEVFIRKNMDRYDAANADNYNPEDPDNYFSLYSIGNIKVNPLLLDNPEGYKKLALSRNKGDVEDTRVVQEMLDEWKNPSISFDGSEDMNIYNAYRQLINNIGTQTSEAMGHSKEQSILVTQILNKRQAVSGVSLDEEMANMLMYQHAYNASARMVNVIDGMIDRIVNGTGRAGI